MGYCKNCGGKLEDNAKFCVQCGTKVELEGGNVQTPIETPAPESTPQEEKPTTPEVPIADVVKPVEPATTEPVAPVAQPIEQTATTLSQPTPETTIPAALNNPANYPNGLPEGITEEVQQPEIVVPSHANIDISQSIKDEARNEAMRDVEVSQEELNQAQGITPQVQQPQIARPTTSPTAKKRNKRKTSGKQVIQTIALIIGSLFALVVIGFLVTFGITYLKTLDTNKQPEPKLELNSKNSYRVGSKDYGYVSVPNSWTPFGLSPENQTIQYTDGAGWIVTLYSVDQSTITAKSWANNIIAQMNSVGASDIGMEETTINDFGGYKLFGYYSSVTTYLAAWVINGNDGKVHYIAIEGPERYNDFYDIIYTFDPTK